jgi:hypothetical protein
MSLEGSSRVRRNREGKATPMSRRRFFGTWFLLAFVMSANGILRETVLVQVMKRAAADTVSAVIGVAVIFAITRWTLRPRNMSLRTAFDIGLSWAGMAVGFDLVVGHYVDSKSWNELAGNYAIWNGKLWPIVLSTVILAPLLWAGSGRREETGPGRATSVVHLD